jgi:hypothetical protein
MVSRRRLWSRCLLAAVAWSLLSLGAPAAAAPSPQDPPAEAEGAPWAALHGRELAARTPHFAVWVPPGSPLRDRAAVVAGVAERVLPTVEARLESALAGPVTLLLLPAEAAPPPCWPRAAALPTRRRIVVFDWPEAREPRALAAFLAHELGHQLTYDRWGALGPDLRLSEGLATWAAEPYWLAWQGWPTLDAAVADLLRGRAVAPLSAPQEGCLPAAERNLYYSVWASFVGYLLREYGWDALGSALHAPGHDDRADYEAAFGQPLEALAATWEARLLGASPPCLSEGAIPACTPPGS